MLAAEVAGVTHAEQLQSVLELAGQQLDDAIDAFLTAGHQSIKVGASDEDEIRTESQSNSDINTGHDAGVIDDLHLRVHLGAHGLQHLQGVDHAIKLAPAAGGDHDAVSAEVDDLVGISRVDDSI